jgi:hypothetical protein
MKEPKRLINNWGVGGDNVIRCEVAEAVNTIWDILIEKRGYCPRDAELLTINEVISIFGEKVLKRNFKARIKEKKMIDKE